MKKGWIVVCICTLAFVVSAAAFAETSSTAPLSREALAAILGPSAVTASPACAALRGDPVFAANKKPRFGAKPKSICNATANCESGTVFCEGNSTCSAVDRDCLNCEPGHVTCDNVTTNCPTACNCNSFTGINRWCCQCACTGDCFSCCRCDGFGAVHCSLECG